MTTSGGCRWAHALTTLSQKEEQKMKHRRILTLLLALAMVLTLTACGATSTKGDSAGNYMADAPAAEMAPADSLTSANGAGSSALPENRKWIITVDMSVETDDMETMLTSLDEHILSLNGYVENQNIYNGSSHSSRRYRSASLTVRVPAENVDRFTEQVSGICNVVNSGTNKQDVTLTYVDIESRKTALEAEEERLLELMEQAETLTDLLEIEARLTDVHYQLESAASQLRTYDNQIDYATIYLHIEEVLEYTPVVEKTVWQRISDGFSGSLKDLGDSLVDLFVAIVVASPFLVVYGGIAAVIFVIVRKITKKNAAKRQQAYAPPYPPWQPPVEPSSTPESTAPPATDSEAPQQEE